MQVIPKNLNGIYVIKGATQCNLISDLLWLPTYYPTWNITIMYDYTPDKKDFPIRVALFDRNNEREHYKFDMVPGNLIVCHPEKPLWYADLQSLKNNFDILD